MNNSDEEISLESALQSLCEQLQPTVRDIASAIRETPETKARFEQLKGLLETRIPADWNGKSFIHPNGETAIRADSFGYWLIRLAHVQGVDNALLCFHRFIGQTPYSIRSLHLYYGLRLDRPVSLTPTIKVWPLTALPPSKSLQLAWQTMSQIHPDPADFAAIEVTAEIDVVIGNDDSSREIEEKLQAENDAAARALIASNYMGLQALAAWYELPETVLNIGGAGVSLFSSFGHLQRIHSGVDDIELTAQLIQRLKSAPLKNKDKLELCLDRLNRSISSTSIEDRSIDLGIALEALMTSEGDANELLGYRISTRLACLCSDDINERKSLKRATQNFYGKFRSAAVHTGRIAQKDLRKHPELVVQIDQLLRYSVRKLIIEYDGDPDWQSFDLRL